MNKIYRLVWNSAQRAWVVAGEFSAAKGKGKNCPRRLSLKAITAGGLVLAALGTSQLANAYTVAGASLVNVGTAASDNNVATNTAFGSGASASGTNSTAIGNTATATGANSVALGDKAKANSTDSMAMGESATATGADTIAIGHNSTANSAAAAGAIALGTNSKAIFDGAVAIGTDATSTKLNSIAIGRSTVSSGDSSVVIGDQTKVEAGGGIAIGGGSKVTANGKTGMALGWYATSDGESSTAIGNESVSSGQDSIAMGRKAQATSINAYALGAQAVASGTYSTAVGSQAQSTEAYAIALGDSAAASSSYAMAFGQGSTASANYATGLGFKSVAAGMSSVALGASAKAFNREDIAIGTLSVAGNSADDTLQNNIVIGYKAKATGGNSTSIGNGNSVSGQNSGSLGQMGSITGNKSYSLGNNNVVAQDSSFVIGNDITTTQANSVVLGSASTDRSSVATPTGMINGTSYDYAGTAPVGVVSVGATDAERQLINVAAGQVTATSTDGINGSQLYATNSAINLLDDNAVKYDLNPGGTVNHNSVTLGGTAYDDDSHEGGTTITNVANGVAPSDAVNVSQLTETNTNISNIYATGTKYFHANSTGTDSVASALDSIAIGMGAVADVARSVALGDGAKTAAAVATTGATIAGTDYLFAGMAPIGTVSVGKAGEERTLTNVAAGRLSATSTDGVNGSQLFATNTAIDVLDQNAVKYDLNPNGTINYNSVTMGGTTYESSTHVGGTTITNVARGVDDSDAVNMSQLNETNTNVTIIGDTLTNIAGDTSTSYTDVHGTGIRYVRTNEAGLTASDSSAEGQGSTAVGYNATSQGESSLAMGREALAKNADDVALGSGSITDIAVGASGAKIAGVDYAFAGTNPLSTVSVGSLGHERTITNVAAGRLSAESTDAINGSQLFATNTAIDVLDQNAVKYDLNPDGTINYNSVTMGGDTYNSANKTGGTKITNVARGVDDSDAVNVSQLNETNTNVTNIGDTLTNIAGDTSTSYTNVHGAGIRYVRTNEAGLVASDSSAEGQGSTALGYNAVSKGESSLAMGREAQANNADDVALGSGSITDIAVGTSGAKIADVDYAFAGINPLSTVSVGSLGRERTITNVAAGRLSAESTDAINGSQLFATNSAINTLDKGSVKYEINNDGSVNYNSIKLAGDTYNNVTKTGGTSITNVAYGIDDSDAVNVQQLNDATTNIYNGGTKYFHANSVKADSVASGIDSIAVGPEAKSIGNGSIAMGNAAQSTGNGSMALGQNAQSVGENSVAMGVGAIASNAGDIALGAGSTTAAAVATTGTTIAGNHYDFAGTAPTSTLSIGSEGAERTITNVAAGRIDASSTDAVNGSQLYATNQAIGNISSVISTIDKGSVKYETNVDGTVNYNKVVLGGDTYDNSTHTGGTTISNVAAGVKDSDAVNKHQLDQVNNSVTNIAEGKDGMFQVNNTSKLPKPKPTGKDAVAGGAGAVASGDNSLALGTSSKATHNNSVALGNNSVTDRDNSVSVGSVGGERQIANVAAGTQGTDAVNVNQLKQGVSNAYNYTDNKFNDLKNMVDDQKDKLSAGISGAMAMASLPQPYQPGASMVSMGGGTYQGESAVALGVSTISDNGKWVTKLSGTTTSQGDLGAAVGVGYQW
ncbi:YadA-like family protein [Buttiauxella gaviniae]|uniref:YadA-like family protein n=1 Tax=Buttiauxella gaviniae TaxID=82990 RepID=UPI003BB4C148